MAVPGFGLYRAGEPMRFVVWFGICHLGILGAALALAVEWVPLSVLAGALVFANGLILAMLRDSFRPGRPIEAGGWLLFAALLAGMLVLPRPLSFVCQSFHILSANMAPALLPGDHVAVDRNAYRRAGLARGDIVVFRTRDVRREDGTPLPGEYYMSRVVALPGETVRIADGAILVDGRPLGETAGLPLVRHEEAGGVLRPPGAPGADYRVPQGSVFVLGDNPAQSYDSRFLGPFPLGNVQGKVTKIWWPPSRARILRAGAGRRASVPVPRR